jgi:Spy/CpxP family protein refolding chaperone
VIRAGGVALAAVLAAGLAFGQEREPRRREKAGGPPDRVLQAVDAYLVKNLQERLGLTDDQLERVVPHVRRLQADRRELARRRFRAMVEMRRVLTSGGATEAEVAELLKQVKGVEAEEAATLRRDRDAIDAVLTPLQQAKYRVLEAEVERRVRHALTRGTRRGRRVPPPEGGEGEPPQ